MLLEIVIWADNPVAATGLLFADSAPTLDVAGCDCVVVPDVAGCHCMVVSAAAEPDRDLATPVSWMLTLDVV
jgi:hypothetical protein